MLSSLRLCSGVGARSGFTPVENLGREAVARRVSTRWLGSGVVAAGLVLSSADARADDSNFAPGPSARRGGFTFGMQLGPQVGSARGYPNDARQIGRSAYLTDTGYSIGGAGSAWVGITFNDYLSFNLAGYAGALVGAQHRTTYQAFAFRVEAFPAYVAGGPFRDLGVSLESGLGVVSSTLRADDALRPIDSGSASRFALGAFYEGFRVWKLATGPFVEADMMWSASAVRPTVWLGWRMNFANKP